MQNCFSFFNFISRQKFYAKTFSNTHFLPSDFFSLAFGAFSCIDFIQSHAASVKLHLQCVVFFFWLVILGVFLLQNILYRQHLRHKPQFSSLKPKSLHISYASCIYNLAPFDFFATFDFWCLTALYIFYWSCFLWSFYHLLLYHFFYLKIKVVLSNYWLTLYYEVFTWSIVPVYVQWTLFNFFPHFDFRTQVVVVMDWKTWRNEQVYWID